MMGDETLARTVLLVRRDVFPRLEDETIREGLSRVRVRLAADSATAKSAAGQAALTAAVVAVAQSGARIYLDVPDVPINSPQPPLRGTQIQSALMELTRDLLVPASLDDDTVDVSFVFGTANPGEADEVWHVQAGDWQCFLGRAFASAGVQGDLPFGGILAGVALAAESLRCALRLLAERTGVEPSREHSLIASSDIRMQLNPLHAGPLDIGDVDVISGGAITNASLFALLRWPYLKGRVRVVDDDTPEPSNLNRYALLRRGHVESQRTKVSILSSYATKNLAIEGSEQRFIPTTVPRLLPLRDRVLVGVDDIPSRWLVARHAPSWICVAGTTHFAAMVSEHNADGPCAGCLHPRDDPEKGDIPTASFVSQLAGYLQAYRLLANVAGAAPTGPTLAAPFNLGAQHALTEIGLAARYDCPVGCHASRQSAVPDGGQVTPCRRTAA
jgi:molybdopterin/thiamine biosynthesis adenylyltransferase